MDSTDFVLRDSEAVSRIKRLELNPHQHNPTLKRLSASIVLSLLLHGGAIAAVAGIVNEFSNARTAPASTIITAHLVTEPSIKAHTVEASEIVSAPEASSEPVDSVIKTPFEKPVDASDPKQTSSEESEYQTVEAKREPVVKNIPSPKQPSQEEAPDAEPETVDAARTPAKELQTNMPQLQESEPEITSERKTTQESTMKPAVSDTTKTIESTASAVADERFTQRDALPLKLEMESASTNEQSIVLAKADRSVIDGAGRRRDATPATGNAKPKYPRVAIRKGYEGNVVLRVTVSSTGKVKDIFVDTGSGYRSLDKSAINSVKRWRFEPAVENGKAVESETKVPIVFRLIDAQM